MSDPIVTDEMITVAALVYDHPSMHMSGHGSRQARQKAAAMLKAALKIAPASPPQHDALKLAEEALTDAWSLLRDVNAAVGKLGLRDKGASGLPHEIRVVAAAFSYPEQPKTPEHVILTGNGKARDLMRRIKEALAAIRAAREGAKPEEPEHG